MVSALARRESQKSLSVARLTTGVAYPVASSANEVLPAELWVAGEARATRPSRSTEAGGKPVRYDQTHKTRDAQEVPEPMAHDASSAVAGPSRVALRAVALTMMLLGAWLLSGCGTTGPVGPAPGSTAEPESASPSFDGVKIEIFIDAQSVTPVDKQMQIATGRPVMLVIRTDHDVTLHLKGPELDRSVYVEPLSVINSAFVVDQPGTVTITCEDPVATIATLTVA
ncbi:MAG: hypothetical protein L0H26_01030 [Microlunatus sp.]|nr:hypothetical protein [Microlunatus sp.]